MWLKELNPFFFLRVKYLNPFWTWLKELNFNWSLFNLTHRLEPFFSVWLTELNPSFFSAWLTELNPFFFSTWLKELNPLFLNMTQRIEPIFLNTTQRIDFFNMTQELMWECLSHICLHPPLHSRTIPVSVMLITALHAYRSMHHSDVLGLSAHAPDIAKCPSW